MAKYAGVDISKYQTEIDYKALKSGKIGGYVVKFAMLRFSYGKSKDIMFDEHYNGCKKAGIYVGVYHWLRAQNVAQARDEAQWLIDQLKDYAIDYPVALDFEDPQLLDLNLGKAKYTAIVNAFMSVLKEANYYVILYTNPNCLENVLDTSVQSDYDLWLAHWVKDPADYGQKMWQYAALGTAAEVKAGAATAVGNVEGVNGPCDVNWCYVGYARLIKELGKNKPIEQEAALGTVIVATKLCKTTSELTTAQNQLKTLGYDYTLHTVE